MLVQDQIQHFYDEGYLVVEHAIDAELIKNLKQEYQEVLKNLYDQWFAEGKVTEKSEHLNFWQQLDHARTANLEWFQPLDISLPHSDIREDTPLHIGKSAFDLLTCPRLLDIAESLLGGEITSNPIQHVRIKPPERQVDSAEVRAHIKATDWHQDRGVTLAEADETDMITVWVAITDATINNGCLQILPRQHKKMLPHCSKKQVAIADDFIDSSKAIPLEVKAGSAIILHPLIPHSSLVNISDEYRWSFDLRYNITGQATGRSHFPDFIARSRKHPELELNDWKKWNEMWQETRYILANSPHIEQHRWQHNSPYCA